MKYRKKLTSILLALLMTLGLSVTAFAAGTNTITVTGAQANETYKIYKMLDLSVNDDKSAYTYTVNSAWKDFFAAGGDGAAYVQIEDGYVTWNEDKKDAESMEAFAKAAAKFAAENNVAEAVESQTPEADGNITFDKLDNGYYLITSTNGTMAMVLTTPKDPKATVAEKNEEPTIDKEVKEGEKWGETNDASIGDTVEFRTTVHAKKGAKNYVVHDQMSDGLTLNQNSITVKVGDTTLTANTDYTVAFNASHKNADNTVVSTCDFEITFKQEYLDKITGNTDIVITYSAILNDKAVISPEENPNKTKLDYGDKSETEWDETKTYTFKFDLVKTKEDNTVLTGAKFKLYDAKTGGNEIALVKENNEYRVATAAEKGVTGFVGATIEAGNVTIKGLDTGTYYLEEIEAPAGFNKLAERVEVKINKANLEATIDSGKWTSGGVQVVNKTGTELPSTGGIGTTIFYVVGAILVVSAGVLLVVKKRMKDEA